MKKIISLIHVPLFLILSINCLAQSELKYKDVYKFLSTKSEQEAYSQLEAFQKQDPFHANVYYQLGVLSQKWAKKYDPLTEYDNLKHFVYHADLYLNLALKYIDEKEAKKNWDLYQYVKIPEGAKKPKFADIINDVKVRVADVDSFKRNINQIRSNYLGIVDNYNDCLQIFLELNANNNQLKDIYLTADVKLISSIESLKSHYDSSLWYFDKYRDAIAVFPLKNYNQEYNVIPIETYRLHGLTNADFLKNDILLWDYKMWVDNVLAVINKDSKRNGWTDKYIKYFKRLYKLL